jgi:hypothetical protein
MHCGAEVTESSTNKQHHLSFIAVEYAYDQVERCHPPTSARGWALAETLRIINVTNTIV